MIERETLESIIAWGDKTFGPCSQDRAIERAWEEWQEMLEKGADVPVEAADVIICLLRIPGILDAINRKMTINRGRTWDVRPDGTGYHVKAAAKRCECGRTSTVKYEGEDMCEQCANYCARRDSEESEMPGGFA